MKASLFVATLGMVDAWLIYALVQHIIWTFD